ncbi:MAG: hypothetical protein ACTTHG_01540 [Treponemataceae bacterium]
MKQKYFAFTFIFILLFSYSVFAKNLANASVVIIPVSENLSQNETLWLGNSVKDSLEGYIQSYTDFRIVDSSNEEVVSKLQKKFEGASYSSNDAIDAGNFTVAKYVLISTVRKTGSSYNLTLRFTDLTTGQNLATCPASPRYTTDELFNVTGSAVAQAVVLLCEQLNIPLTSSQKYTLMHGQANLSYEEALSLSKKEQNFYNKQIEKLNKEIDSLSLLTDETSSVLELKLRAEKALTEEKLAANKKEQQRILEEQKKKNEEEINDAKRSAEQKKHLESLSLNLSKKVASIRDMNFKNASILTQISVIEAKKKALIEIREGLNSEIEDIENSAEEHFQKKKAEIENVPWRMGELDSNNYPIPEAVKERGKKIEKEYKAVQDEKNLNIELRKNAIEKEFDSLLSDIRSDMSKIQKKRTAYSLHNELKVSYGKYDGARKSWTVFVYFYDNNILLYQTQFELKYAALTGEKVVDVMSSAYLDRVDFYNSLFQRGEPVLAYELDYYAKAKPDNFPSTYDFLFKEIRISETTKVRVGKNKLQGSEVIAKIVPVNGVITRQWNPVYDIREESLNKKRLSDLQQKYENQLQNIQKTETSSFENHKNDGELKQTEQDKELEKEKQKLNRDRKYNSYLKSQRKAAYNQSLGNGSLAGSRFSFGFDDSFKTLNYYDFSIFFSFSPYFFFGFNYSMSLIPLEFIKPATKQGKFMHIFFPFEFGSCFRFQNIGFYPIGLYLSCGLGLYCLDNNFDILFDYIFSSKEKTPNLFAVKEYFVFKLSGGIDMPVHEIFSIFIKDDFMIFGNDLYKNYISLGVSINFR